ncbi:MAG: hypothetical protein JXB13_09780 [Phycisphaerae bacterium]|nr:hypothetical protein [Phycisphaerae bacterium]
MSAERVFAALAVTDLLLVVLHITTGWGFVNLDREANLPAWYSSIKLLATAVLCALIFAAERGKAAAERHFRLTPLWLAVGGVFLFLSVDELASLHEGVARFVMREFPFGLDLREAVLAGDRQRDAFAWVILLSPFIAGTAAFFLVFFYQRFRGRPAVLRPALAGVACFILAIGCEATMYGFPALHEWTANDLSRYQLALIVEESGEMLGTSLLVLALMRYRGSVL